MVDARWIVVYLGLHKISDARHAKLVFARSIKIHPRYRFPSNDVALIKVRTPISFTLPNVGSVCLPERDVEDGESVLALGWGKTSDRDRFGANALKENVFTTISDAECRRFYSTTSLDPSIVCTKDPAGQSVCQGDSGSGLGAFTNGTFYQLAIVSFTSSLSADVMDTPLATPKSTLTCHGSGPTRNYLNYVQLITLFPTKDTMLIFNSLAKSNRTFYLPGRKYLISDERHDVVQFSDDKVVCSNKWQFS